MEFSNIIYEKKDGLAKITLNRADVLNALDPKTLEEIYAAIEDIEDDISVRVAVITANGRAFCTGADLTGIASIPPDKPRDYFLRLWNKVFSAVENVSVPVIAVVNGMAYAGGLELVMVCDLAIASEDAKLSDQHANRGLVPGGDAGRVLEFVSTRSPVFKSRALPRSKKEAIRLMLEQPSLIRRPVLVRGRTVLFGFDKDAYGKLV